MPVESSRTAPFSIAGTHRPARRTWARLAESALGLGRLNALYERTVRDDPRCFSREALQVLQVTYDPADGMSRIPSEGPLLVVANHPFGGIDGLVLHDLLGQVRADVRILGNHLLGRIPELRDVLFPVDPFGGPAASRRNAVAVRQAARWLSSGGCVAVFPAGEVAHAGTGGAVVDPAWIPGVGRLALLTGSAVLPVYFDGRNSTLFRLAGALHPLLRTALLPREILKRRGTRVRLQVGHAVPGARLRAIGGAEEITDYLRARTYILQGRIAPAPRAARARRAAPEQEPIVVAAHPALMRRECEAMPAEQILVRSGAWSVRIARSGQIPEVLREIGRLREGTFRQVGEGTGRSLDLDRFDRTYHHLFLWNEERSEVGGAYRIGPTDEILPLHGCDGLYTSTLFRYRRRVLDQIGPALELGRSFVRAEYQRESAPLALLWKGIGAFVVSRPRYRRLFGPVSISNTYDSLSRRILARFLSLTRYAPSIGRWIRPRTRYAPRPGREEGWLQGTVVRDLDQVDDLIREIEADRKGMPVLLRHYLRLNAELLGFNLDPDFGDVLDGLMLVDLTRVPRPILSRFMGRDGMESFLEHHRA